MERGIWRTVSSYMFQRASIMHYKHFKEHAAQREDICCASIKLPISHSEEGLGSDKEVNIIEHGVVTLVQNSGASRARYQWRFAKAA